MLIYPLYFEKLAVCKTARDTGGAWMTPATTLLKENPKIKKLIEFIFT